MKGYRWLILLIFILLLSSCEKASEKNKIEPIKAETRYTVGVKTENFQTIGILFIRENGDCHFLHSDPNSPLFGMEEIRSNGKTKIHYQDIEWQGESADTIPTKLCDLFKVIYEGNITYKNTETQNNRDLLLYQLNNDEYSIRLYFNQTNGQIKKILGKFQDQVFEITFSDTLSKSPNEASSVK